MVVLRIDEAPKSKIVIPTYRGEIEAFTSYLSLLYGKRFTNHGGVEVSGFYNLPDLSGIEGGVFADLPQNREKPRADIAVPLTLEQIERIAPLLTGEAQAKKHVAAFWAATKFYQQALHAAEHDVEVAYLHLITAGEIVASAFELTDDEALDADIRSILGRMEVEMRDGKRAARAVRGRMMSIKRRFVAAFRCLVDDAFFERHESDRPFEAWKRDTFIKNLAAAYDVRSKYVHTGQPFGGWITPNGPFNAELQFGKPFIPDDKEFGKLIGKAPTYVGLERLVRYGILRFGERELGLDLEMTEPTGGEEQAS
jgi:hypothetical protein